MSPARIHSVSRFSSPNARTCVVPAASPPPLTLFRSVGWRGGTVEPHPLLAVSATTSRLGVDCRGGELQAPSSSASCMCDGADVDVRLASSGRSETGAAGVVLVRIGRAGWREGGRGTCNAVTAAGPSALGCNSNRTVAVSGAEGQCDACRSSSSRLTASRCIARQGESLLRATPLAPSRRMSGSAGESSALGTLLPTLCVNNHRPRGLDGSSSPKRACLEMSCTPTQLADSLLVLCRACFP